jgi:hypothetical protein
MESLFLYNVGRFNDISLKGTHSYWLYILYFSRKFQARSVLTYRSSVGTTGAPGGSSGICNSVGPYPQSYGIKPFIVGECYRAALHMEFSCGPAASVILLPHLCPEVHWLKVPNYLYIIQPLKKWCKNFNGISNCWMYCTYCFRFVQEGIACNLID